MRQTTLYARTGARKARADRLPGELCLYGSVGKGGANARADVSAVQAALNGVPTALAGPAPALAIDGLAGPLTNGAIAQFQGGWLDVQDGRIDPGGPTLGCLNAAIGAPSARAADDLPARATGPAALAWGALGAAVVGASGLAAQRFAAPGTRAGPEPREPEILAIIRAMARLDDLRENVLFAVELLMKRALDMAQRARDYANQLVTPATRLPGWNSRENRGRLAFLLLAKHFHLSEAQPDRALEAATRVLEVAHRIRLATVSRRGAFGHLFDQGDRYVANFRRVSGDVWDAAAYNAVRGGGDIPGRPTGKHVPSFPPAERLERTDRIYLTPLWDGLTNLTKQAVLVHELTHFTGGVSPGITDPPYAYQPEYKTLAPARRLRTTDCYALYFIEPEMGSANAATALSTTIPDMGSLPFIGPDGVISLPQSPTDEDPFAFPCSFPIRPRRR